MKTKWIKMLSITCGACWFASSAAVAQVVFPYTNDFSSSVADFNESSQNGTWTLDTGGTGTYLSDVDALSNRNAAALDITGIGGATPQDFRVTTNFTVNGANGNASFGLALFGDSTSSPTSNYLLVDASDLNLLRILNVGGPGNGNIVNTSSDTTGFTFADGETYNMVADFDYTGLNLVVSLTVSGNGTSGSITSGSFNTSGNLDNSIVALTNRSGPGGAADPGYSVTFDDVSVTAIPEPSAFALLLSAGFGLLFLRRRRA